MMDKYLTERSNNSFRPDIGKSQKNVQSSEHRENSQSAETKAAEFYQRNIKMVKSREIKAQFERKNKQQQFEDEKNAVIATK